MYKTFLQPYFLYAIEIWGHIVKSDKDILNKIQSKILRIIFNCKRSDDAWRHFNNNIPSVSNLYNSVIKNYVCTTIMPEFNINQLENKITRISLSQIYDYKIVQN